MKKYLKALTIVFLILGLFGTTTGLIVFLNFKTTIFANSWIAEFVDSNGIQESQAVRKLIVYAPMLIASVGLHFKQRWGRIMGIFWSVLNFADFPVGTIFGIFGLWVLFKKETKRIFKIDDSSFF